MFTMLNEKEVLVPLVKKKVLSLIMLNKKERIDLEFDFTTDNFDCLDIYLFWETQIFCVKEDIS